MVCKVFACDLMFTRRLGKSGLTIEGGYSFIGTALAPEIAAYTFAVLRRQINKARKDYISTALKRHRKNKTAAADEFCMGWVMAAQRQITSTARTPEQDEAIAAYKRIHYANAVKEKTARLRETKNTSDRHIANGWEEGRKARVHQGMSNNQNLQLGK
jgi:hypothetical protein